MTIDQASFQDRRSSPEDAAAAAEVKSAAVAADDASPDLVLDRRHPLHVTAPSTRSDPDEDIPHRELHPVRHGLPEDLRLSPVAA